MSAKVKIMGIVNVNGDSFFSGSRVAGLAEAAERTALLFEQGADAVDIGACSSRPGSVYEGEDVEWSRLEGVLQTLRREFPGKLFSIDTFSSRIVQRAFDEIGPFMVNDITAAQSDPALLRTVVRLGLPYIAMHNLNPPALGGTPVRPLIEPREGEGVMENVLRFFESFSLEAEAAGLAEWILDPGFGFGKSVEENLALMDGLERLQRFGREILIGVSRKRMTWQRQGLSAQEALPETLRLEKVAIGKGAAWVRCHDVRELVESLEFRV